MNRNLKTLLRTLSTLLVCIVILFAFSVSIIRLFGFEVYGVLTGSMEPKYPTGSLIYVKKIDTSDLDVGDVISFKVSQNVIATHRIVELVPDANNPSLVQYRTKGDANDVVDSSLVSRADIIGKVVFCVPKMGYVVSYIQSGKGVATTIVVSLLLILFVFFTEFYTADDSRSFGGKKRKTAKGRPAAARQPQRRPASGQPQRRPAPRYEDGYAQERRAPSRYQDDYAQPRRTTSRYQDDYAQPRRAPSRYQDDYAQPRRMPSRYQDDYAQSARTSSRYQDDYPSRAQRSASRYGDSGYRSQSSGRAQYDDASYRTRSQSRTSSQSGRYASRFDQDDDY